MSAIRILIVEDELIIAEKISKFLKEIGYEPVGTALDYDEGLTMFEEQQPDVVLSDINLKGNKDGVDLVREIKSKRGTACVFITSYADKGTVGRAKDVQPDAYLVKPVKKEDLYTAVEMAISKHQEAAKDQMDELLCIQADDIYCHLITTEGKHLVRSSLKSLLQKLPGNFVQVHRSWAANKDHVQRINHYEMTVGNQKLPIGRAFRDELVKGIEPL